MPTNEDIVRTAIVASPYGTLLGVVTESVAPDVVRVRLPFRSEVTTIGDLVHGGALASLIDVAATAAVWSGVDLATTQRGTTIGFSVNFVAGARGRDVTAEARVVKRGGSVAVVDVDVRAADGTLVARALVTYKIG